VLQSQELQRKHADLNKMDPLDLVDMMPVPLDAEHGECIIMRV